jgi:hypothetical protein
MRALIVITVSTFIGVKYVYITYRYCLLILSICRLATVTGPCSVLATFIVHVENQVRLNLDKAVVNRAE